MAVKAQLQIHGLDAFRRELARIDPKFAKEMGKANKQAAEHITESAASRYRGRYRSMSSRTRSGIKALAQQRSAKVRLGGPSTPYMLGQEFGSNIHKQFPAPNGLGYYFWPAIRDEMPKLKEEYLDGLDAAVKAAFPR